MTAVRPRTIALLGLAIFFAGAVPGLAQPTPPVAPDPDALTMQAATTYALEHNAELQGLAEEVRMAEAGLRLARAAERLQASVNAYGTSATAPNMVTGAPGVMPDDMRMIEPGQRFSADVRVTQSLANGGRLAANVRQRRSLQAASEADLQSMRLQVFYDTRAMYRMALLRGKLVDVRKREVEALAELVRVDEVKLEAGKIPLYYYLRDKTRLAEAQQAMADAGRDLEVGLYELSVMLGLDRPRQLTLTDGLGFVPVETQTEAALQAAAANRPELAAVRARLEAAAALISAARAAYRPQLAATVIFDFMAGRDEASNGGYTAALVGSLPLTDGGMRAADVAMAEAQQRQLTVRERQVAREIAKEVLVALSNLKAADQNVRTSLEARASAEEDYRIARLRYDAGKAINLEPLDALAALVRAQVNAAQALYEFNNAVDALDRAQGAYPPAAAAPAP